MWAVLALTATALTSLLPILNKRLLSAARSAIVAWAINLASLPVLALGTLFFTHCFGGQITAYPPAVDAVFAVALAGSALLNWLATIASLHALALADASLVTPLLTFNPVFTLLVAWLILDETPGVRETCGVAIILLGAYLLDAGQARAGIMAPVRALYRRPGTILAMVASALWGITTVLEKVAIEHTQPASGPFVALASTVVTVAFLTPGAWRAVSCQDTARGQLNTAPTAGPFGGLAVHPYPFVAAALIAGVAPLFGFTAIALGSVGYVTALFKLSAVLTVLWAKLLLHEGNLRQRLLGAAVMVIGGALVAA